MKLTVIAVLLTTAILTGVVFFPIYVELWLIGWRINAIIRGMPDKPE
ncbi:hypothetical protein O185_18200 [Photorhabdus temperata J3]|uniref:Uncharacterized protein n=1 Tax=Photorhabdus temperata J3 TaxID=1389415 RepID=U7QUX2_PHOTE|nr:hypothetical protein O185_18200 [Photorhabdus temperata J3]